MRVIRTFAGGLISVLKVIGSRMLYRYPYRVSAEGLRSDWLSIGKDIENVMGKLKDAAHDER